MNLPARLVSLFAFLAVLAFSYEASALTFTTGYPKRPAGKVIVTSGTFDKDQPTSAINRADCLDTNQKWELFFGNAGSAAFVEVWATASSDKTTKTCDAPCARGVGTDTSCAKVCYRVAVFPRSQVVGVTSSVAIYPYQIIGALNGKEASRDGAITPDNAPAVCTPSSPNSESTAIVLWALPVQDTADRLLITDTGGPADSVPIQTAYDIAGPGAPANAHVKPAGGHLNVYFDSVSAATYKDLVGLRAYCWPTADFDAAGIPDTTSTADTISDDTGSTTATDSRSDSDDAATDDASSTDTGAGTTTTDTGTSTSDEVGTSTAAEGCPPDIPFKEGDFPPGGLTECGSVASGISGELTTNALTNYQPYAVAVAAYDKFGNSGQLSAVSCATPREITDFYQAYKDAGGQGGGGYCAFNGSNRNVYGLGLSALVLGIVGRLARRRHRTRN